MLKKFFLCIFLVCILITCAQSGYSQQMGSFGIDGRSYYILLLDQLGTSLQPFTCTFATDGTISINMEGKTFASSAGTYVKTGKNFNGTWEATETVDTKQDDSISYSFLFVGRSFANDFYIIGIIYSTIVGDLKEEEDDEEPAIETISGVIPFFGIVVSIADEGATIQGKVTEAETGVPIPFALVETDPGGYTATTSATGEYTLSYIEPGTYTITVSVLGYEEASKADIEIGEGETVIEDFSLSAE